MNRLLMVMLALLGAASAWAAPPYDVTATFDPPVSGGTPTGYRLYQGCVSDAERGTLVGSTVSGQTFAELLQTDGTFTFCVAAFNESGEGPVSGVVQVQIDDFDALPGSPTNLQITVSCDTSCNVIVTVLP